MDDQMVSVFIALVFGVVIAVFALFRTFMNSKKMQNLEETIEGLSTQFHQIQKDIQKVLAHQKFIENSAKEGVAENINTFYRDLKEIREMVKSDRNYFEEKLIKLDSRVRDFGHLSGMNDVDEKRIISLFKDGWSVDSIAKELRIGRGEVEFTLKIADI